MSRASLINAPVLKRVPLKLVKSRFRAWFALILLSSFCILGSASAITTLSQGYTTTDDMAIGSIVSIKNNSLDAVNAADSNNVNGILGIVIGNNNSLLSLSSNKANQIQVATSGIVQVLVSDINGSIREGDEITASPISGVGMKATNSVKVVGIAQDNLTNNNASKETYKDKSGATHSVLIGQVPVLVNVSYFYKQPDKTLIPSAIQNIANALAGKTVSSAPILICMAIFIVAMVTVVSIVFSAIHSSIISVGRNPMSQSAIYRNLLQISALVVAILVVAVVSIYMILTRF